MTSTIAAALRLLDRRARRRLWLVFAGSVVLGLLELVGVALVLSLLRLLNDPEANPDPATRLVRALLTDPNPQALVAGLGAAVFISFLVKNAVAVAFLHWQLGFSARLRAQLSGDMLDSYIRAPYAFHLSRNSSEVIRTTEHTVGGVFTQVVAPALGGLSELLSTLAIVGFLLVVEPLPALIAATWFVVLGAGYQRVVKRRVIAAGAATQQAHGDSIKAVSEAVGGIKELLARNRAELYTERYRRAKTDLAAAERTLGFVAGLARHFLEAGLILGLGLLAAVVFATRPQAEAVAVLGLFLAAGYRILPSLKTLLSVASQIRGGSSAVDMVQADLDELVRAHADAAPPRPVITTPRSDPPLLTFERVSFSYATSERTVLAGVDLSVAAGTSLGLVGPSGAGKSTVLDLALGLLTPTEGHLAVDGELLDDVVVAWRARVGYVPQAIYLADDTLAANIAFGWTADELDLDRVAQVAALAQLDDVVAALPKGLQTMVGERGVRLSGGQRQRIGLARALYTEPEVLLLDEATSALDNDTEARISATLSELQGSMTMLVVAHRLSTVRGCDQLAYIDHGQVLATGSFDELHAGLPAFRRLVALSGLTVSAMA